MQWTRPSAVLFLLASTALALGILTQLLIASGNFRWAITPFVVSAVAITLAAGNNVPRRFTLKAGDSQAGSKSEGDKGIESLGRMREFERALGAAGLLLSLVMLVDSLWRFSMGPPNTLAWYLFGASITLLLLVLPSAEGRWTAVVSRLREGYAVRFQIHEVLPWAALVLILVLAAAVRLYHLQELPAGLWFDEADNLAQARMIQADPGSTPVFAPSTNLPSLFLLPIAAVVELTGVSITAPRLASVIFGLAGIVAVFLLVRLMLGPFLALLASFLTAVMRWDINWSRIGMHGITTPLFAALTVYLTLRALRSGHTSAYGYAGASLGLGMWFYTSFRLFPLVLGFILLHHAISRRPKTLPFLANVVVMGLVALIVASPVVQSAVLDPEPFFARTTTTAVFSIMPLGDAIGEIKDSLGKHALMFNYRGDANPRHNLPQAPMLDFWSAGLLLLGLGVALARWRNVALLSLPVWLFVMILPGVLTLPFEAPQSLRAIGVIPAVAVLATLPLGIVWWAGRSAPWRAVRRATPILLGFLLGMIAFLNIGTYFGDQARHPEVYASFSTDETLMAKHMLEHYPQGSTVLVSRQLLHSLTVSMLANNPRVEVLRAPTGVPVDPSRVWMGATIYLEPRESSVYRLLQAYYPDGRFETVRPPGGGRVLFYSVVLTREQLESRTGLEGRYSLPDGSVRSVIVRKTEAAWQLELPNEEAPFDLRWEGSLHVVESGEYLLVLDGEESAEVLLDGRRILWDGRTEVRLDPAVGLHSLEVVGRVQETGGVLRLLWQPPGGELVPIPEENLYHGTIRPVGLAGRFYEGGIEREIPDAMRVTPMADAFYYDPVVPEPYLAVWEGTLDVSTAGQYGFRVSGAGGIKLIVDGEIRAQSPGADPTGPEARLDLETGEHRIRIEYASPSPPSIFGVLWEPPGGSFRPIPVEHLSPAPEHMFRIVNAG